ncbi:hypothetical protein SAMN05660649_02092 [Desulfotomaculum arcticum]|uniref:Formamidopyrimidine-DNA glycosylase catalytic domain-containing protein n=1 Tax=Desulfotruncus arcticus DSM 17038 TaxID=1121424 RepID=A0A1I2T0A8_9FIRM|nr:DNA-formamidopyrimidine glycosylase family protein [Desulfotruncus arcticus]SFG58278.1 hypothetical protein SAMN05660649_02092 [Desulfotomaculum arcticum] [Desulfotruncus arcticus DSM 17038]
MPELPEIFQLSEQMNREFRDKTIKDFHVIQEKCLNMPAADFISILTDKRIEMLKNSRIMPGILSYWYPPALRHGRSVFCLANH